MNYFNCNERFDRETNQPLGCEWEMILTDETVRCFGHTVFPFIGIDLLQGQKTPMADGRTRYTFALDSERSKPLR